MTASCPAGKTAVGGGANTSGSGVFKARIYYSVPTGSGSTTSPPTAWLAKAVEIDGTGDTWDWTLTAHVICAKAS